MDRGRDPVIVIGMHRSGTTMITDILQRLGLFIGWVLQENSEALFFVRRNERLMNACGGSWAFPEPVENLLAHEEMRRQAAKQMRRDMESFRFATFLGPRRLSHCGSLGKLDFPWGWKDPRNTYLLPLWLDLFPNAKIIHIYRHPMDVARSLQVRERRMLEERLARLSGTRAIARSAMMDRHHTFGLLWMYRRWCGIRGRLSGLGKYERLGIGATLSLRAGLKLWEAYVAKCCDRLREIPNPSLSLKYEDFLVEPVPNLERLCEFCGLSRDKDSVETLCREIRKDRRYAYRSDVNACEEFAKFSDNKWVRELGYSETPDSLKGGSGCGRALSSLRESSG